MNYASRITKIGSAKLLLIAFLLCLLAVAIPAYPTFVFFTKTFEDTMFTTAEFDANSQIEIQLPDNHTRYILGAIVPNHADDPPAAEFEVLTDSGEPVEHWESNGYMSKFGDHFRRMRQFRSPESGRVVVTAISAPNEDFVVFRHPKDVYLYNSAKARPWWFGAAVPFFSAGAILLFVIARKVFQRDELSLDV